MDWESFIKAADIRLDKYMGLKNFQLEVTKVILTKHYELNDAEKVPII